MMFKSVFQKGSKWRWIPGRLKQIEAGPNGMVVGTNNADYIYFRTSTSRRNPTGRHWVRIGGRLNHVSIGCRGMYGVNKKGLIWRYYGKN